MPLYDLLCEAGHKSERSIPLSEFSAPIICACGQSARRVIGRPMISVENVEYTCPITDTPILSKRAHEDNLRRHDCRVYESGETRMQQEEREQRNLDFDKKIETTVEREWDSMSGEKREALAKDLTAGADLVVERK